MPKPPIHIIGGPGSGKSFVAAAARAGLAFSRTPWTIGSGIAQRARIRYLTANLAANPQLREAFLQGLRDLGYVEGRTVVIGKPGRLPALVADLVALKDLWVMSSFTSRLSRSQQVAA